MANDVASPTKCALWHNDVAFGKYRWAELSNSPLHYSLRTPHYNRRLRPETCHLQLVSTLFVSATKERGSGATHHPAFVTLRRCPPPYLPLANRDDSFAPHNKLIQSARSAPKLATCHWCLRCSFHQRRVSARGRPTTNTNVILIDA